MPRNITLLMLALGLATLACDKEQLGESRTDDPGLFNDVRINGERVVMTPWTSNASGLTVYNAPSAQTGPFWIFGFQSAEPLPGLLTFQVRSETNQPWENPLADLLATFQARELLFDHQSPAGPSGNNGRIRVLYEDVLGRQYASLAILQQNSFFRIVAATDTLIQEQPFREVNVEYRCQLFDPVSKDTLRLTNGSAVMAFGINP